MRRRLTEAYQWGGIQADDYRQQLGEIDQQLARAEQRADEGRIMNAIKVAQDLPTLWDEAPPERRRQLLWSLFERVKIDEGKIVSVRPKPELAPLLALAIHICGPDRIRTGDLVLDRDVC